MSQRVSRVAVAILMLSAGGCVVPAMRPMRTVPGLSSTVAAGLMSGAEDERTCYEGCEPEPVTTVATPVLDVRHGWMLAPHLGVTGGLHLFGGPHVAKTAGWRSLAVAYGQVSWQNELAAAAVGLDVGGNVIAPVLGMDVQPWGPAGTRGEDRWRPNLALYARHAQPFVRQEDAASTGRRVRVSSWDAGVTVRVRPVMVQYSYYRQAEGAADFPAGAEGSVQARAWHVVLVGVDLLFDARAARRR
jgi:hypothetical protein